jgi:glycosyltransferase involved in cell wall biosynthesis
VLAWPAFRKQRANPHAALLARELIALGVDLSDWTPVRALLRPGHLWHLHHPETVLYRRRAAASILETCAFLGLLVFARARGVRVLWTIHDLGSNDALHPRLEAWFWKVFVPRVDGIVCLSEQSRAMASQRFPALVGRPACVVPHGHYGDAYPRTITREEARRQLALLPEATVLLHFGLIRSYKNVAHLIRRFRAMPKPGNVLFVVGKPFDAAIERELRDAARDAPNVRLDLRWVPPEEVQTFFVASDLVVLPYRRILNSGAVMLALTFACPVLVPDLGSMRDQQEAFGAEWIRLYSGDLTSAGLAEACRWARTTSRRPPDLGGLDWTSLAPRIRAMYEVIRPCQPRTATAVAAGEPAIKSVRRRSGRGNVARVSGVDRRSRR